MHSQVEVPKGLHIPNKETTVKTYPKGHLNQHKQLATGVSLRKPMPKDLDPSGWGDGKGATLGRTNISSGSTGSGGGAKSPPKSTFTPA